MKNKLFLIFLAALITVSLSGCIIRGGIRGNGNVVSRERPVTGFSGLTINGAANINVYTSESYKVIVTTDSNIQDIVETKILGDSLQIGQKPNTNFNPTKFVIDIYMPEIKNISVNGAGDIKVAEGKTSALEITLNGAGKIDAQNYEVQNVDITLSGAGEVTAWAASTLTYKISGVGNIRYKGEPNLNGNISGIGRIRPL